MSGDIYYFQRMNAGAVNMGSHYMRLCEPGHFDLIAIMPDPSKRLLLAFIELKRPDTKAKLSPDQELFQRKYSNKHPGIKFWLVQSSKELSRLISENIYNRLNDVEFNP
jgi:hypothetical protein